MRQFCFIILSVLFSLNANAITPTNLRQNDNPQRDKWVDSVYASLSARQRVAQLFIPMINPADDNNSETVVRRHIENNEVGGLLFSKGSIEQYATLINYAQSISNVPLLVTLDGEWGLSMRIKDTPRFPYNMGLGAIKDETLLYNYGREVARQCREMGIHVNFAPVLDVNSNPGNPVIGYRSFGEDPHKVSHLGLAYSRGLEDGGVLSVAKHFPGHGDTSVDSHDSLPTIYHSQSRMIEIDLIPFESYIECGLSGIMVGHLSVPAYDNSGTPASLSKEITTGLLQETMGFEGLVFTDALSMKGAQSGENKCVAALLAGADVLLAPGDIPQNISAVINALNSGKISWSDIEKRCKKILTYKYTLNCHRHKPIDLNTITDTLNSPQAEQVNRNLAASSITALFNNDNLLPIKDLATQSIAVVNIGAEADEIFSQFCAKYAPITTFATTKDPFTASQLAEIKKHDIVIVAVYDDSQWARNTFAKFKDCPNLIPVFFTTAYRTNKFRSYIKDSPTLLLAYDDTPYTREYAAQAIFGGIDVTGRLPVNLNGLAPMGSGVDLKKTRLGYSTPAMAGVNSWVTDSIDVIINNGLTTGAFPGCQLIVAKNGNIIIDRSYGNISVDNSIPVTDGTLYDLASVSKAAGTLPGIMKAYDLGLFRLDSPVSFFINGLREGDKADITIRELLYHESGMPASLNMFDLMMDTATYIKPLMKKRQSSLYSIKIENNLYGNNQARLRLDLTSPTATRQFNIEAAHGLYVGNVTIDTIRGRIYNAKLRKTKKYNYSCLNFCLLMELEEHLTGISHDRWVNDSIFAPLGAYHTCYRPLNRWDAEMIAATECDQFLRRQILQGYVHDEIACFSGGVQGNAGLFSNATDLAKLCQMWLNGGTYGGVRILSEETVELFTTDKSPNSRRGLGFDKPDTTDPDKSPTAEEASAATFGHIGFTGTCFWVDPESELIYIFLCNRVNPTRNNKAFSDLNPRPTILSLIYRAMCGESD